MGLHLATKHSVGVFSIGKNDLRRTGLWLIALTLIATIFTQIPVPQAFADVPLYGQESANGIGSRSIAAGTAPNFALDSMGNIFVGTNVGNHSYIRKFANDGSFIKDFTHSDPVAAYEITSYARLAVDNDDNLYAFDHHISDNSSRLLKFDNDGNYLTTITGISITGGYIIFDHDNNFYVSKPSAHKIYKYSSAGTLLNTLGTTSGSANGQYNTPKDVAIDSNNNLVVGDYGNFRIQIISSTGTFIRKFGQKNTALLCPAQPSLDAIMGLTLDDQDNIYIASQSPWCTTHVLKFDINGGYIGLQERGVRSFFLQKGPENAIYAIETGQTGSTPISRYTTAGVKIGATVISAPNTLNKARDVAQDSLGNSYVVDRDNSQIHKFDINYNHLISFGSNGSGNGQFESPNSIAIDSNDNIYISDYTARKITKFDTAGTFISKFGVSGTGDGQFDTWVHQIEVLSDGNLVILDGWINKRVQIYTPGGTFLHKLNVPYAVSAFAVKSNDHISVLFPTSGYSDPYIRSYDKDGVYQNDHTSATLTNSNPYGTFLTHAIFYDRYDNLYARGEIAYQPGEEPYKIARLNLTNEDLPKFTLIAPEPNYDLELQLYFTATNQLLVTDLHSNYVHVYNATSIAQAPLAPTNLAVDSASLGTATISWTASADPIIGYKIEYKPTQYGAWVTHGTVATTSASIVGLLEDTYDIRVSALNEAGLSPPIQVSDIAITGPYAFEQKIDTQDDGWIHGIAFDSAGKRYESDYYNDRINVYNSDGTYDMSIGSPGSEAGEMYSPKHLVISSENKLYVSDYGNDRVSIFELDGTYISSFGEYGTGDGQMRNANAMALDENDNLYVVNRYRSIQKFDKNGIFIERVATDALEPTALAFDDDGNMYVANDTYDADHGVIKYDPSGNRILHFGSDGEEDGQMYEIFGIVINPAGQIVINDVYNYRLQVFDAAGNFVTKYGLGYGDAGDYLTFDDPETIAQAANGDLYIPNGYSPYTQVLSYTGASAPPDTGTAPTAPQTITAEVDVPNKITVKWTAPANDGGDPVTTYKIESKKSSEDSSSWVATIVDGSIREHVIDNAQAGCHDIRVSAGNGNGYGTPTSLTCVTVVDPAPILVSTPSPVSAPTPVPTPTTSDTTTTDVSASEDATTDTTEQQSTVTISPIEDASHPGQVIINWLPPVSTSIPPTGYVIEYRDTSSSSDSSAPWQQIASVDGSMRTVTITLPSGEYEIRVAALMPGETPTRVILGVARVAITGRITHGDGPSTVAAINTPPENNTVRNWIIGCAASVMTASIFIIPLLWKRRRKKNQQKTTQTSARRY